MSLFWELVPDVDTCRVDWARIETEFEWFRQLAACPQDRVYHAEGDVQTHTRLVVEALVDDPYWRASTPDDRAVLFWAALLHDVAKPATTRIDADGRIAAPGHSRRGQITARVILWRLGAEFALRERIAHLVTHHQVPFFLIDREAAQRLLHLISLQTRCDLLAVLASADVAGRICPDADRLFENIALFRVMASEEGCLTAPRQFPSAHSRFLYFRKNERSPSYEAYDDWGATVTLLSGLPASGKDTWVKANSAGHEVIALDEIRRELGVDPGDGQGAVVTLARERARVALRAGRPLIWNATNLGRDLRRGIIDLAADYKAKVSIVYCEAEERELRARNAGRERPVPDSAIARMLEHWQPPDLSECHDLSLVLQ